MTFKEFYDRLCLSFETNDKAWQKEMGYRPEDKDSGFSRWLEITGNKAQDFEDEFMRVVYWACNPKPIEKSHAPVQLGFGF